MTAKQIKAKIESVNGYHRFKLNTRIYMCDVNKARLICRVAKVINNNPLNTGG